MTHQPAFSPELSTVVWLAAADLEDPYAYPYRVVSPHPATAHDVMFNGSAEYATAPDGTRKRSDGALKNRREGTVPCDASRETGIQDASLSGHFADVNVGVIRVQVEPASVVSHSCGGIGLGGGWL